MFELWLANTAALSVFITWRSQWHCDRLPFPMCRCRRKRRMKLELSPRVIFFWLHFQRKDLKTPDEFAFYCWQAIKPSKHSNCRLLRLSYRVFLFFFQSPKTSCHFDNMRLDNFNSIQEFLRIGISQWHLHSNPQNSFPLGSHFLDSITSRFF